MVLHVSYLRRAIFFFLFIGKDHFHLIKVISCFWTQAYEFGPENWWHSSKMNESHIIPCREFTELHGSNHSLWKHSHLEFAEEAKIRKPQMHTDHPNDTVRKKYHEFMPFPVLTLTLKLCSPRYFPSWRRPQEINEFTH